MAMKSRSVRVKSSSFGPSRERSSRRYHHRQSGSRASSSATHSQVLHQRHLEPLFQSNISRPLTNDHLSIVVDPLPRSNLRRSLCFRALSRSCLRPCAVQSIRGTSFFAAARFVWLVVMERLLRTMSSVTALLHSITPVTNVHA